MTSDTLAIVIATLAMLVGFVGIMIPMLPGLPLMFAVTLIYALTDRFSHISLTQTFILLGITLLSVLVDYLSGLIGAKVGGASKSAVLYGLIGYIVGLILLPPLGGLLGLIAGILIGEWRLRQNSRQAIKAATGGLIGALFGVVINFVLALVYIGLFLFFVLR